MSLGDLFSNPIDLSFAKPLAERLRPEDLDRFQGQTHLLAEGKPLRHWIETDQVPSMILWGPPGCGKTTLARIIAARTQSTFVTLSAVSEGAKKIKESAEQARHRLSLTGRKTILFVDEIHRFNKGQQDALLPDVENGILTLIGATTENPSFEINSALLSRTRVLTLHRLEESELKSILLNALENDTLSLSEKAIERIAGTAEGDARRALTLLDSIRSTCQGQTQCAVETIDQIVHDLTKRSSLPYDKNGEEHYNVVSAFIKSVRDSDPDAGLYYLARMLEAGEDPLFIVRRLVILASEDIGNADPRALQIAIAAKEAVHFVGMPEARINLAQAVTYLAIAPKSNASYLGIESAIQEVHETGGLPVPFHLRNAVTGLMKSQGYGKGYRYAHDDPKGAANQHHLPEGTSKKSFYLPSSSGLEQKIKDRLKDLKSLRRKR